jgi:hypothetical protein
MNKICKYCNIEKDINEFYSKQAMCKECSKLENKKYRENNKEKIKYKGKLYYKNNIDKIKEYRENNIEKIKEYQQTYQQTYQQKYDTKEYMKNYNKERRKYDDLYRLSSNMRRRIRHIFKSNGYKKNSISEQLLGCSYEDFKIYLESKFEHWMSYDNYGLYNGELNYGWDIDHICPLSNASSEDELIKLCHYTNLQPLCSKVNRDIKKAKAGY